MIPFKFIPGPDLLILSTLSLLPAKHENQKDFRRSNNSRKKNIKTLNILFL